MFSLTKYSGKIIRYFYHKLVIINLEIDSYMPSMIVHKQAKSTHFIIHVVIFILKMDFQKMDLHEVGFIYSNKLGKY